jgi:hypothetical protein
MKSYSELRKLKIFVNNRKETSFGYFVGRPSVLGNPFKIGLDGNRDEVIDKYRAWLWGEIKAGGSVWKELQKVYHLYKQRKGVVLLCFCYPEACHAQVIGSALVWMQAQGF